MAHVSAAIVGANYMGCRSFAVSYTTASTSETSIAKGSYEVTASTDAVLKIGVTGMAAAAALPSTQPTTPNAEYQLFAGQSRPIDIPDSAFFRVIANSTSGTITFNGPIASAAG